MTNTDSSPGWSDPTAPTVPPAPPRMPAPPEVSVGAAPMPAGEAPAFAAPDNGYTAAPAPAGNAASPYAASPYAADPYAADPYAQGPYGAGGYPVTSPPAPGYGGYGGYPGQAGGYYPAYAPAQKTNSMAIASMVVSIVGAFLLFCYGAGGLIGIVGAILGHVSRRQIRDRQESGDGMALAGIVVGWIAAGLGLLIVAFVVIFIVWAVNSAPTTDPYDTGYQLDALRLLISTLT